MSQVDLLFWIMITSLITSIINTIEIIYLIRSSRRTNEILENPAPIVSGFLHALEDDKDFAKEFGSFVVWCGQAALSGVKQSMEGAGMKPPKIKSFGDALGFLIQLPQIQQAIQTKAAAALEGAGKEAVKDSLW